MTEREIASNIKRLLRLQKKQTTPNLPNTGTQETMLNEGSCLLNSISITPELAEKAAKVIKRITPSF